ncbi:zeta-carotene-forming phytoene desaturase [Gimesia chilikensis]|uniref:Pyridine nucleotide-disulfide oxidoreductase domain-containing protein 2 n=1 Tax=Gimesia chilikensis TaxID=2605989 RepID=A0A517WC01_9PLAN|nr:NAD(P)/FAD-dependent oxidoreductase [Gimesia chilikensis]QDU02772.1 zeta-carotene-forming phytoene desaturase [Gimesia chilikensis]
MYDCVIIGAGHNGLVCAHQLARQGWKVLVLERRELVGGACVTEELWPGFKVSTASYLVSLLLPEIEQEMELARYGYRVLPRNPSSFTPCADGRSLLLGPDLKQNQEQIAQFSQRDAEQFPRYEAMLERIAECLEPALVQTPPDLLPLPASWRSIGLGKKLRDTKTAYHLHQSLKRLGETIPEAIELLTGPALSILDRWFESDVLKSTLATDAIIGTFQPPSAPGTAYVLLHHVMGSAGGARGVWGYVEGGMGALSQAMAASALASGVEIRTGVTVDEILIQGQQTTGVRLSTGETITTRSVASNADAHVTFEKLIPSGTLPQNFSEAVSRIDYRSASMKINVAVSELPDFSCLPGHNEPGPQHRGTIHIGASCEEIERAYDDAKYGMPSQKPIIEMTIPTAVDSTLAPEGQHILSLFVQYAPYQLKQENWDELKEEFADRCLQRIAEFAPNVPASVLHRQVLSPLDLERTFSLTGGNIFQGAMPAHQLYNLRPVPGWSDYRTPIKGLYLCGSAAHPGGGVMGACGRNAAREMLRDGKD